MPSPQKMIGAASSRGRKPPRAPRGEQGSKRVTGEVLTPEDQMFHGRWNAGEPKTAWTRAVLADALDATPRRADQLTGRAGVKAVGITGTAALGIGVTGDQAQRALNRRTEQANGRKRVQLAKSSRFSAADPFMVRADEKQGTPKIHLMDDKPGRTERFGRWLRRGNSDRAMRVAVPVGAAALATLPMVGSTRDALKLDRERQTLDRRLRAHKVAKADRNDAALAAGAGGLAVAANYNTPERIRRARDARSISAAQRAFDEAKGAPKGPDRGPRLKATQGAMQAAKEAAKKPMPVSLKGKQRMVVGGLLTGGAGLAAGYRGKAKDRPNRDREAAAMTAGAALPIAAAAGSKKIDRHFDRKVAGDPRHNAHREAHGKPSQYGDSRWNKLYESYPKDVPGGRYRRVAARTLAGKGLPVTMTATGLGGLALARRGSVEKLDPTPAQAARKIGGMRLRDVPKWAGNHKKAIGVPLGIAAAAGYGGKKRETQPQENRGRNATAAAIGGQAAFRGVGYGAVHQSNRAVAAARRDGWNGKPYTRSQSNKHMSQALKDAGLKEMPKRGDHETKAKLHRNIPLDAPGARGARIGGHMSGRRGWAINVASTAVPAALVAGRPRKAEVGKATTYGYLEERRNRPRQAQQGAGAALIVGGASHLQVGRAVERGQRFADVKGKGAQYRTAAGHLRSGRNEVRRASGAAVGVLRGRVPGFGTALDVIPAKLRPHAAIGAGALLAARATPSKDERFVPTGRF